MKNKNFKVDLEINGYDGLENDDDELELEDEFDLDELDYEDLDAEEALRISEELLNESIKMRDSIPEIEISEIQPVNIIELRSPENDDESLLKKRVREMINAGEYERKDFIEYLDGDNEQARKMINTYPKKKDFKMEEFVAWVNFLGYNIKIRPDENALELGELRQTERDDTLITFEQDEKFIEIKKMLVDLINGSGLMIKNVKSFFSDKPSDAFNIIERFKKNATMTTDTFGLWLTLIGYEIEFVSREK